MISNSQEPVIFDWGPDKLRNLPFRDLIGLSVINEVWQSRCDAHPVHLRVFQLDGQWWIARDWGRTLVYTKVDSVSEGFNVVHGILRGELREVFDIVD